jgi:hypothetical protein
MAHLTCHQPAAGCSARHSSVPFVDGNLERTAARTPEAVRMTRSQTLAVEPVAVSGWRVIVTESRCEALVHHGGATEQQARALIALLASGAGAGGGPWRQPVAGGQRLIELKAQP